MVIIGLLFIILFYEWVCKADEDESRIFLTLGSAACSFAVGSVICLVLVGITAVPVPRSWSSEMPIRSAVLSSNLTGSFILGCGGFGVEKTYYFYTENENGELQLQGLSAKSDKVSVRLTDEISPRRIDYKTGAKVPFLVNFLMRGDYEEGIYYSPEANHETVLIVPANAIEMNNFDLNIKK